MVWGHVSDGNLHPNVIPRTLEEWRAARKLVEEIGQTAIRLGGAPMAEHGVGRNLIKQQLLRELYGADGIDEMRAVKRAIDPEWKLSPGVLFPRQLGERRNLEPLPRANLRETRTSAPIRSNSKTSEFLMTRPQSPARHEHCHPDYRQARRR